MILQLLIIIIISLGSKFISNCNWIKSFWKFCYYPNFLKIGCRSIHAGKEVMVVWDWDTPTTQAPCVPLLLCYITWSAKWRSIPAEGMLWPWQLTVESSHGEKETMANWDTATNWRWKLPVVSKLWMVSLWSITNNTFNNYYNNWNS